MTDTKPGPSHGGLCGARTRHGGTCQQPAGFGTDHPGHGACKFHLGCAPNHQIAAARQQAEQALRSLGAADPIGDPIDALARAAGALRTAADELAERIGHDLVTVDGDGNERVSPLYTVWRDLIRQLHDALAVLARLGVPEVAVTVNTGVPVADVLDRVTAAVQPYPDAAAAVSAALLEIAEEGNR